jgi:hypothetical protein
MTAREFVAVMGEAIALGIAVLLAVLGLLLGVLQWWHEHSGGYPAWRSPAAVEDLYSLGSSLSRPSEPS